MECHRFLPCHVAVRCDPADFGVGSDNVRLDLTPAFVVVCSEDHPTIGAEIQMKNAHRQGLREASGRTASRHPGTATNRDLAALAVSGRSPSELRRRVARLYGEPLREPLRISRGGLLSIAGTALLLVCGPALWPTRAQTTDASPATGPKRPPYGISTHRTGNQGFVFPEALATSEGTVVVVSHNDFDQDF